MNAIDKCGRTVIMEATPYDKCVELLINKGARVKVKGNNNVTALLIAAEHGYCKSLKLLIQAGADVNPAYKYYKLTALMIAAAFGRVKCVDLLLEGGADVHATDRKKCTALKYAVDSYTGNVIKNRNFEQVPYVKCHNVAECIILLVSAAADINATDGEVGILPLVILKNTCTSLCKCKEKSVDKYSLVRHFLNAGANLSGMLERLNSRLHTLPLDVLMLILAAGATETDFSIVLSQLEEYSNTDSKETIKTIEEILPENFHLMSMCRWTIREHLLHINPHTNLFSIIPLLGLPFVLTDYLFI